MQEDIPKINFKKSRDLGIEIMRFEQLAEKLNSTQDHDPFGVHKINFHLILLVKKGSYDHFVDFQSYEVKVGSCLFVANNQVHHFGKNVQTTEGIAIVFNQSFIERHYFLANELKLNRLFNYHIENPLLNAEDLKSDPIIEFAEKLHTEYHHPERLDKSKILAALLYVLLLKAERAKSICAPYQVKLQWIEVFQQFRTLLEKEYIHSRNARDYAGKLFISYKFLNDIVKQLSGKTVKHFIDDFVIIEIKRYLVSTALSIKEISLATGFDEVSNMTKFFKKNTQITPTAFRTQS